MSNKMAPDLGKLDELAKVHALSYASPHHFTMSVNGLREVIAELQLPAGNKMALDALKFAEAALADIGDADREPGDDLAWCEARAAEALPRTRAEVTRLAAQAAPTDAQADLVIAVHTLASHFENTLYALRDDAEAVTKAKGDIAHALKIAAKYNRNGAAAQPSQAPVVQAVQAGEYPPLPPMTFCLGYDAVTVMKAIDADRASSGATAQAVRMLTAGEIEEVREDLWRNTQVDLSYLHACDAAKAFQRKLAEVNAGRAIPADGKIGGV